MKEWFRARNIWGAAIQTLTDEEAGRLMKALWEYTMTGNQVELQGAEKGIYALILMTLNQDNEWDDEISAKRSRSGSAGGRPRKANALEDEEEKAKKANAFQEETEKAKKANAPNKNKNKSKNNNTEKDPIEKERMFERFWAAYPRKEAKQAAWESFDEIEPDETLLETMITAIEAWKKSDQWTREGGRFIPHPGTWLNQKRWEDELPKGGGPKAIVTAQQYGQRDYSGVNAEIEAQMDREMELYTKLGGFPLNQRLPCDTVATGDRSAIAPQTPFGDM